VADLVSENSLLLAANGKKHTVLEKGIFTRMVIAACC
jgi:hypothetical protein